ncbi:MAG: ABC transporter ATP-binding protein [Acidimicrobiia bacterium]|nr:ABC transporter ATP-binding protein [Acidimicrobiia bacterium]
MSTVSLAPASVPTIAAPHPGQVSTNGSTPPVAARAVNATKIYGSRTTEVVALDGVSLDLHRGRFVAVMGPSGSGKSTLMHCLAGLDDLSSGEIFIGDVNLSAMSEKERTLIRRDRIGFVFQSFNLIPTLTAEENITLPLDLAGRSVDPAWFDHVLDAVGLRNRLSHKPDELSGGQQQRVAVSRALISRPEIIFADEPTGNLDSASGDEILSFMRRATDDFGQTIVMVTHDPIAAAYADSVLFLTDGRIVDNLDHPTADSVLDVIRRLGH